MLLLLVFCLNISFSLCSSQDMPIPHSVVRFSRKQILWDLINSRDVPSQDFKQWFPNLSEYSDERNDAGETPLMALLQSNPPHVISFISTLLDKELGAADPNGYSLLSSQIVSTPTDVSDFTYITPLEYLSTAGVTLSEKDRLTAVRALVKAGGKPDCPRLLLSYNQDSVEDPPTLYKNDPFRYNSGPFAGNAFTTLFVSKNQRSRTKEDLITHAGVLIHYGASLKEDMIRGFERDTHHNMLDTLNTMKARHNYRNIHLKLKTMCDLLESTNPEY